MLQEMKDIVDKMQEQKSYPYIMCKYSAGKEQIRVYPESILYIAIRYGGSEVFACGKLKKQFPKYGIYSGNGCTERKAVGRNDADDCKVAV